MRNWKVILSIMAIFIAGTVTGAVLTLRVVKAVAKNQMPERWPASLIEMYQRRLHLTPEQLEKIRPAVEEGRKDWQEAMRQTMQTHFGVMRRINEQLVPLLDEDQKRKQEQMRDEMRKKMRERFNLKQLPES